MLHYVKEFNKVSKEKKTLVILGCLTKIHPMTIKDDNVILIGPVDLTLLDELFMVNVSINDVTANKAKRAGNYPKRMEITQKEEYYIQICHGCINSCTYCAIKKAKGHVKSKEIDKIIIELQQGLEDGYEKFMLLADDCGSYGLDIGTNFADLLNKLASIEKPFNIGIFYIEPHTLLMNHSQINKKIWEKVYFINIPIQTVSHRILKLMNRDYNIEKIISIIKYIKKINPSIYIATHIMYGFPSETREEFYSTLGYYKYFSEMVYFFYTDKKGTISEGFSNKVNRQEMLHRTYEIIKYKIENDAFSIIFGGYRNVLIEIVENVPENNEKIDVLLIYPRTDNDDNFLPPLSLLLICEQLIINGYMVKIIDERLDKDTENKIKTIIKTNNLLAIGMTCYTGLQIKSVIRISSLIKELSNIPFILGGPHATLLPEQTMEFKNIDIVVIGEGERSFLSIINALKTGNGIEKIEGVGYKKNNEIIINGSSKKGSDINLTDYLPIHLVAEYLHLYTTMGIQTSRGCPNSCKYCVVPKLHSGHYFKRDYKKVARDIVFLNELNFFDTYKVLYFIDDNLFCDIKRVKQINKEISNYENKKKIKKIPDFFCWWAEACVIDILNMAKNNLLQELINLGLTSIYIGAESGSDKTLKRINKPHTVKQLIQANKILSKLMVQVEYTFMLFPFEKEEDINMTFSLIEQLKKDNPNCKIWKVNYYTPYPNTALFKELEKEYNLEIPHSFQGWSDFDWYRKDFLDEYDYKLR